MAQRVAAEARKEGKRGRVSNSLLDPDPPSRHHLQRCLRSLLLAAYCSYASVVAPWRLASDALLVIGNHPEPYDSYVEPSTRRWICA